MAKALEHLLALCIRLKALLKRSHPPSANLTGARVVVVGGKNHNIVFTTYITIQPVVFFPVHPLADSDPAERTQARQDTPTADVLDFLANPDAPPPPDRPSFAEWLGMQPQ